MRARQDQSVEGGTAYQAQGNLTVTNGMDADQMAAVMVAMATQLQVHFAEAQAKLDDRLNDFREAVLKEFAKPENEPATEAFKDPDFQFVLNDAQKVFVRDGTPDLRDDLVKLLMQRSQYDSKDRLAKILNYSIEIAGSLSKSEYAALAFNFVMFHVRLNGSGADLLDNIARVMSPLIADLSDNPTVYEYLEAQRCVTINHLVTRDWMQPLVGNYASALSDGFTEQELFSLDSSFSPDGFSGLIMSTGNLSKPYRFKHDVPIELFTELKARGMSTEGASKGHELWKKTVPDEHRIAEIFDASVTGWSKLRDIWEKTPLSQMTLTAVGKAIAHSTLSSRTPFRAPLETWVS